MELYKYLYIFIFFKIYILCQNETDYIYINKLDFSIKNAVYIIKNREGEFFLDYTDMALFIDEEKENLKKNYLLIKDNQNDNNEEYFYIKEKSLDIILSSNDENKIIKYSDTIDKDYALWKISPKVNEESQLIYYIQNKKTNKYWYFDNSTSIKELILKDTINLNAYNEFQFIELYKENEHKESKLLEEEPIDIFIKYIDLSDPNLNRTGISQVKKEEDNQELRYSIRSILQNIPWIRKIFILMPNEKVKYFKSPEEIKDKIIYVKDKDLLGFDTASSNLFRFNLFRMKKFGLSENFILMDDDYFIAQPLNKSDFFYEEDGKILPYLITNEYYEMNKDKLQNKLNIYLVNKDSYNIHTETGFDIIQKRTLLFMYKIFGNDDKRYGKKLIQPGFSHNAIPVKISEIEEMYNYINNNYDYANIFLSSLVRTTYDLHMHTFYMTYVKNKYDRKVSKIPSGLYDLSEMANIKTGVVKLFVINTSNKNYNNNLYIFEKKLLNSLFPNKTQYELDIIDETKNEYHMNNDNNNNNNINDKPLINYNNVKYINETILNKTKKMNESISLLFNGIDNLIDKVSIIINNTIEYKKTADKESINKSMIYEEINNLKKGNKWGNRINLFIFCIFFIFVLNKIFFYCGNKKKNNYINKKRKRKYKKSNRLWDY